MILLKVTGPKAQYCFHSLKNLINWAAQLNSLLCDSVGKPLATCGYYKKNNLIK